MFEQLTLGKQEIFHFRFTGVEIDQSPKTYTVKMFVKETTMKLEPMVIRSGARADEPATPEEKSDMWSITGSTMWIARSGRPGLAYRASALQSTVHNPTIADLREANKVVAYARSTSHEGMVFRSDTVKW